MLAKHNLEKGFRVEIEKIMKGLLWMPHGLPF
jgi:hypothetical protein